MAGHPPVKILYASITDTSYLVRAWALYRFVPPHLGAGRFLFYCSVRLLRTMAPAKAAIIPHDFNNLAVT